MFRGMLLSAGIYYLTLWLHGIEWFPKVAIFGAVATLLLRGKRRGEIRC
jgi:hypothetical protein